MGILGVASIITAIATPAILTVQIMVMRQQSRIMANTAAATNQLSEIANSELRLSLLDGQAGLLVAGIQYSQLSREHKDAADDEYDRLREDFLGLRRKEHGNPDA